MKVFPTLPFTSNSFRKHPANEKKHEDSQAPGEGALINSVYMGRLRPDFQPLTLSYTTFGIKGTLFVYVSLKNGASFTYLLIVR